MNEIVIRPAVAEDVPHISALIEPYARAEIVLPRSPEKILDTIDKTLVAVHGGVPVGTVTYVSFASDLWEIRALVVRSEFQNSGAGRMLVEKAVENILQISPARCVGIFALTYVPVFFEKLGFRVTVKESYPEKIFEVCRFCPRQENCNEIAVERIIDRI